MAEIERLKLAMERVRVLHCTLMPPKNYDNGLWSELDVADLVEYLEHGFDEFNAALWKFVHHGGSIEDVEAEGAGVSNFVAMIVSNCRDGKYR